MNTNSSTARFMLTRAVFAALTSVVFVTSLRAATTPTGNTDFWNSTGVATDVWSDTTHWTPKAIPTSGDTLDFTIVSGTNLVLTDNVMTPATYTLNGITIEQSGFFNLNPATTGTNGFTLTTGITNKGSRSQGIADKIALSGTNTFTMTAAGGLTLSGGISDDPGAPGSLIKNGAGAGALALAGTNTYTGSTTVSAGSLFVNGSLTSSAVTVAAVAGATLGGTGTIAGPTVVDGLGNLLGGTGAASGKLTLAGLTMQDNSDIELTLGSSDTHSSLARSGGVWSFDANQAFTFLETGSVTPGTYDNIITGLTGTEAGLSTISTWVITDPGYQGTFSLDSSHNVDLTITAVPEPNALLLTFLGLGSFLAGRRIRRRSGWQLSVR